MKVAYVYCFVNVLGFFAVHECNAILVDTLRRYVRWMRYRTLALVCRHQIMNNGHVTWKVRQKSSYKTLQICNFYVSHIRYLPIKQSSDNYQNKSLKTRVANTIFTCWYPNWLYVASISITSFPLIKYRCTYFFVRDSIDNKYMVNREMTS